MVVCVCRRINDAAIRRCVDEGATTLRDLRERLGVALECGICARCARGLLRAQASGPTAAAAAVRSRRAP